MSNEKMENLLNLALDATEREREKSLDLDTGYDRAERTWEVIVKFGGTEEALRGLFAEKFPEEYDRIRITNLRNEYAILLLPEHIVELVAALTEIDLLSSCFLLHKSSVKPDLLSCHIKNRLCTFRESLFLSILLYTEFSSLLLQLHRYRHLQHQHLLTHLSPEQVML